MALVLITHDMGVVAETVDRVIVMYAGQQVEAQAAGSCSRDATHPYTAALLAALPERARPRLLPTIPGVVPGVPIGPTGCLFNPRCGSPPTAAGPSSRAHGDAPARRVRCHYPLTGGVPTAIPARRGAAAQ